MGLVDYSESDSGSEPEAPPKPPSSQSTPKRPFQKVVDRSKPGKIVVGLPQATISGSGSGSSSRRPDEPPAKRARTARGGLFSGLNSSLPPPKNTGKPGSRPSGSAPPRPGINLKTSAAPGFSRDADEQAPAAASNQDAAAPSMPLGHKPADQVTLVGRPLMFRPLSVGFVARGDKKAKSKSSLAGATPKPHASTKADADGAPAPAGAPRRKTSLFPMHTEEQEPLDLASSSAGAYEPLFESAYQPDARAVAADDTPGNGNGNGNSNGNSNGNPNPESDPESLDAIARDLNLSAAARRELFGRRDAGNSAAKTVVNFNMDKEYQHNESVRAAGDQQVHKAVRSIQGGGKHSLKQLVQNVQNQRDALEDSFATARTNKKATSSKYGW
ncbi:Mitotic checkpoint protein PRCC [Metarhizium album ARSEF 1941]|uniref:Mitotic checkpoint protein PRCC n=1 Tax=Metarhizium album (strain ARSEF 1941) TaxID=1081103 RepID=A0A0B2X4Z6_METAS|nr:Mitotic checkpoint protein PRCC [Metarhizium album ARSEF 1941]KHO00798.1 Mitotic checkpoint protein PRCC [Metarhizium album ARSEF 1941]